MHRILLILTVSSLFFTSCGMLKRGSVPWESPGKVTSAKKPASRKPPAAISTAVLPAPEKLSRSERDMRNALDLALKDWQGVPYVLGGSGYTGVDCSSFMQIVFEDYFQISLPRTTREQMKLGKSIRKNKIRMGDLVFFKTGRNLYHVGVMVDEKRFLHASTSSGVMISDLGQSYWQRNYLTTRRVM